MKNCTHKNIVHIENSNVYRCDLCGTLIHENDKKLIDYIYDFAWHYGRFYHIGDAEKIKAAIAERFMLPEEFVLEAQAKTNTNDMPFSDEPSAQCLH